jgi:hypothetical protein
VRHARVDHGGELAARAETPPARRAHANDPVGVLLAGLAHRVQPGPIRAARDPHLVPDGTTDRGEPPRIRRAVLAALPEVVL